MLKKNFFKVCCFFIFCWSILESLLGEITDRISGFPPVSFKDTLKLCWSEFQWVLEDIERLK